MKPNTTYPLGGIVMIEKIEKDFGLKYYSKAIQKSKAERQLFILKTLINS